MGTEFIIDAPHLMEALNDDGAAEILRQMQLRAAPVGIKALSELVAQPADRVQAKIDLLCSARLVAAVRAGRGHRAIRYAAVAPPLRIRFREEHHEEHARDALRLAEFVRVVRARIERRIAEAETAGKPGGPAWSFDSLYLPVMSAKERDELISRVRRVTEYLGMLEERRGSRKSVRKRAGERVEPSTQHVFELRVRPLRAVLPPELSVEFFTGQSRARKALALGGSVASLSPRELQVTRALAEGLSRPQIAKMLGISLPTVATLSRRLYRKLGVRSRAQLTRMILEAPPTSEARVEESDQ
jgi:DNA-binding CsgD family transcriptional regulator